MCTALRPIRLLQRDAQRSARLQRREFFGQKDCLYTTLSAKLRQGQWRILYGRYPSDVRLCGPVGQRSSKDRQFPLGSTEGQIARAAASTPVALFPAG
jgi:hypothetical protein